MEQNIMNTITTQNLLTTGSSVLLGVSGGADSIGMLHFFHQNQKKLGVKKIVVCHINHMLREESEKETELVKEECKKKNIPCFVSYIPIKELSAQCKKSLEETGRIYRYEEFFRLKEKLSLDKIITAHHENDLVETFFLNGIRGSGLRGLASIPYERDGIIRPFLDVSKEDIYTYCRENNLKFYTDSSNEDNNYSRNYIRNEIIPRLEQVKENSLKTLSRTISILKIEDDFLQQEAQKEKEKCILNNTLLISPFLPLHEGIQRRCIILYLQENHLPWKEKRVVDILTGIKEKKGKITLEENKILVINKEKCHIITKEKEEEITFNLPIKKGIYPLFHHNEVEVEVFCKKKFENHGKDFDFILNYDKIKNTGIIRNKQIQDRVYLSNRKIHKSLKKFLIEEKIPKEKRKTLPLLVCENKIIGITGAYLNTEFKPDSETKEICTINFLGDYFEK